MGDIHASRISQVRHRYHAIAMSPVRHRHPAKLARRWADVTAETLLDADGSARRCGRSIVAKRNLTQAESWPPPRRARRMRGYTAIFGRDAAVCALGMALSGDALLERAAATGLHTLAAHQAPNGQIPKFVDLQQQRGRLLVPGLYRFDAVVADCAGVSGSARAQPRGLLRQLSHASIQLAMQWLLAQEHQRFFLLQQNEASDWADIMPRSGFVLYTNALWYFVKRLVSRLQHARADAAQLQRAVSSVFGRAWPSTGARGC